MVTLTAQQAAALEAFCDAFDTITTGVWAPIAEEMKVNFDIEDPEEALEDARRALRGES